MSRSAKLDLIAFLADLLSVCPPGETGAELATRAFQENCVDAALGELLGIVTWELRRHPTAEIRKSATSPGQTLRLVAAAG